MLIKNSFQLKPGGFSNTQSSVRRQATTVFSQLNTSLQQSLDSGFLHTVVKVYKQNPFMVSSVAVFSLISFVFVIVIFSLTGGHETTLSAQRNLFSGGDDALFSNQYAKSKTKYDLNVIALNVIEGKAWDKHHIDDFAAGWNRLSATEKTELKQTVWFQLLENTIKSKISGDTGDKRVKLLANLAAQLELTTVAAAPSAAVGIEHGAGNTGSRAKAETVPAQTVNSPADDGIANPTQSSVDDQPQQLAQADMAASEFPSQSTAPSGPGTTQTASAAPVVAQPTAEVAQVSPSVGIQSNPRANTQASIQADASPNPSSAGSNRVNKVIRTPFPQNEQRASNSAQGGSAFAKNPDNKSKTPASGKPLIDDVELRHITDEFVSAYESGNIITFTALFAENAVSNDDTDLKTIRKEYANLFATTSDRRMIIDGLKWDFADNIATGKGQLEVSVKSTGDAKFQTYSGTVQIVVEKHPDGAQISKLYHALQ
jgi:hypothetical protein